MLELKGIYSFFGPGLSIFIAIGIGCILYFVLGLGYLFFKKTGLRTNYIWFMAAFLGIATLFVLIPNSRRAMATYQYLRCTANENELAEALTRYSKDHNRQYPTRLEEVVPRYLKAFPRCPAAGQDTYSDLYVSSAAPDAFTIYCGGHYHRFPGKLPNYPRYSSWHGLMRGY